MPTKMTSKITVSRARYYLNGATIGVVHAIPTTGRTLYLAEGHDWDGDNTGYSPLVLGVFEDPEQAVSEIEIRARFAQAPVTTPSD